MHYNVSLCLREVQSAAEARDGGFGAEALSQLRAHTCHTRPVGRP